MTPIRWLSSLNDYYSWSSQTYMGAPKFENLAQECKDKWRDEYEAELRCHLPDRPSGEPGTATRTEVLEKQLKMQTLEASMLKERLDRDTPLLQRALKALEECGSGVQTAGYSNTLKDLKNRIEEL